MLTIREQIAFWGHPYSSGFPSIDYFITSDSFEPKNEEINRWVCGTSSPPPSHRSRQRSHNEPALYTEQLLRLSSLSASFLSALSEEQIETHAQTQRSAPLEMSRRDYFNRVVRAGYDIHNRPYSQSWNVLIPSLETNKSQTQLHIYSCLQSLMKMHEMFDDVIAQVLFPFLPPPYL
jgi:hypothetical protein